MVIRHEDLAALEKKGALLTRVFVLIREHTTRTPRYDYTIDRLRLSDVYESTAWLSPVKHNQEN